MCSFVRYASFRPGVAADLVDAPEYGGTLEQIDLALEQGGDVLGIVLPDVDDAVDVVRILGRAPPGGIADHDPAAVRLERLEHERAGAVGVARGVGLLARPGVVGGLGHAVLLRPGLRHDGDVGELQPQRRIRPGGREADGVIVDRLDRGDAVDTASESRTSRRLRARC